MWKIHPLWGLTPELCKRFTNCENYKKKIKCEVNIVCEKCLKDLKIRSEIKIESRSLQALCKMINYECYVKDWF